MIRSADKWLKGLCVEEFWQSLLAKQFTNEQENTMNLMFLDSELNILYIQAIAKRVHWMVITSRWTSLYLCSASEFFKCGVCDIIQPAKTDLSELKGQQQSTASGVTRTSTVFV